MTDSIFDWQSDGKGTYTLNIAGQKPRIVQRIVTEGGYYALHDTVRFDNVSEAFEHAQQSLKLTPPSTFSVRDDGSFEVHRLDFNVASQNKTERSWYANSPIGFYTIKHDRLMRGTAFSTSYGTGHASYEDAEEYLQREHALAAKRLIAEVITKTILHPLDDLDITNIRVEDQKTVAVVPTRTSTIHIEDDASHPYRYAHNGIRYKKYQDMERALVTNYSILQRGVSI